MVDAPCALVGQLGKYVPFGVAEFTVTRPEPGRTCCISLLPATPFQVLAYPVETVLAEKVTTAVARGETNTRDLDWADLWRLTAVHGLSGGVMTEALRRTAAFRRWLRRQGRDASRHPQEFADVVADVLNFTEPLLTGIVADRRWDPARRRWREPT